jgi:hypothetical protein
MVAFQGFRGVCPFVTILLPSPERIVEVPDDDLSRIHGDIFLPLCR